MARFVVRFKWLVLLLILAITAGCLHLIQTRLIIDNSLESFAPSSEEMEALYEYRASFGRDDHFLVLIEGDVFSAPFLEKLAQVHEIVAAVDVDVETTSHLDAQAPADSPADDDFGDFEDDDEGWGEEAGGSVIEDVVSLINARQTVPMEGGGIQVLKLLDPIPPPEELPALRDRVLSDKTLTGRLVGASGRHTVVAARTLQMRDDQMDLVFFEMRDALKDLNSDDFRIQITGPPAINAALNEMVLTDLGTLATLSTLVMLLALAWLFRHLIGIVGPIIVVAIAVLWTLGFMAAIGFGLNILSSILPAFLLCVGVGDSIHMLSIYRDLRRHGMPNEAAIVRAVAITGPPVLFTSLTTMTGLFSLWFAQVYAVSEMGVAGGVGVMFALTLSLVLLPIMLTWNRTGLLGAKPAGEQDVIDRVVGWAVALSDDRVRAGRLRAVFAMSTLLAVVAVVGLTMLEVWHDDMSNVPDGAEVKLAVQSMDENVGGVSNAVLVIKPDSERGMKDLPLLRGLEALTEHVFAYRDEESGEPVVRHAISVVDVVKETRRAFHGGGQAEYRLPDTQGELDDLLFLFENQGPAELRKLATLNLDRSHLTFQATWLEATSYKPLIDHIRTGISTHVGDLAQIRGTGMTFLSYRIVDTLLSDLIRSFATAFVCITILMLFMLGDLKLGLVAMLPNLFPIVLIMGGMGLTGIPIDLNNLLIASIALGIAVDDTIHFLHHFKTAFATTADCEQALVAARHHAGRAMFSTSVLLSTGFGVYLFALNNGVARFGSLIGLTVVVALLVDLIVLPALLRHLYGKPVAHKV